MIRCKDRIFIIVKINQMLYFVSVTNFPSCVICSVLNCSVVLWHPGKNRSSAYLLRRASDCRSRDRPTTRSLLVSNCFQCDSCSICEKRLRERLMSHLTCINVPVSLLVRLWETHCADTVLLRCSPWANKKRQTYIESRVTRVTENYCSSWFSPRCQPQED